MKIFPRGGDAGMTKGGLNQVDRRPPIKGMAGVGMT
jgi:hypothetical protein